jgi:glycosyltransferase involved in cell wall biosynthesis
MEIKISIALVTRNRPDQLRRCLKSVRAGQSYYHEIIVSDDSDDEDAAEKNQELCRLNNCHYFKGPRNGLYANRNHVAQLCRGTHIRTMDDDHTFPDEHFKKCLAEVKETPDQILTIGEYFSFQKERGLPPPIPGQLHPRGFSVPPPNLGDYCGISCGGTIYPRKVIDSGILNCDLYKFGKMYLEYGMRLRHLGYSIRPMFTTYLIHHHESSNQSRFHDFLIQEARVFAMLSLSKFYRPTILNRLLTSYEILKSIVCRKIDIHSIRRAYDNHRKFIRSEFEGSE